MDFRKLLGSFAQGDTSGLDELIKRQPNGPPALTLTPAQEAIKGIGEGVVEAEKLPLGTVADLTPQRQQTMTLGGLQSNPVAQGIADQPSNVPVENDGRVVPGQPVMQSGVMERPPMSIDPRLAQAREAHAAAVDAPIEKQSKWKDFGAYAIQAANAFFNKDTAPIVGYGKIKHDIGVRRAGERLAPLEAQQKVQLDEQAKMTGIDNIRTDNVRQAQAQEHKIKRDELKLILDQDTLDFKKDVADKLAVWRNRKLDADIQGNVVKGKQAQQRIDELVRNNKATEAGRTERATMKEGGANRRQQITIAAQKEAAAVRAAEQSGNQQEAAAARERLLKLKQEYESGN
jgi:hypothetical protein